MKMFPTNELRVAVDDVTKTKLQAEPTVALAAFHFAAKYFRQLAIEIIDVFLNLKERTK